MASYGTTTKHALRKLLGSSNVNEIDTGFAALADDLDALIAVADAGLLSSRPTSSGGSPGKAGRLYYAGDEGVIYFDTGTGWIALNERWRTIQAASVIINLASPPGGTDYQFVLDPGATSAVETAAQGSFQVYRTFRVDPADFPGGAGKLRLRAQVANTSGASRLTNGSTLALVTCSTSAVTGNAMTPMAIGTVNDASFKAVASSAFAIPAAGAFAIRATLTAAGLGAPTILSIKADLQWTPFPSAA
jgi:hypothetical protein